MLLILIPLAWLTVVALFVAVCQAAARGDAEPALVIEAPNLWSHSATVVCESSARAPVRRRTRRPAPRDLGRARSRRLAAREIS